MRVLILILTALFDVWGFVIGIAVSVGAIVFNRTIAGKSYIYPLIPLRPGELKKRFFRGRLPVQKH
jgi:stage V sporulation protein AF